MSSEQMSLFDINCFPERKAEQEFMISVRKIHANGVNQITKRAVFKTDKMPEKVKNKIFKDKNGVSYVGCRFLEREPKEAYSNCLQLKQTEEDLSVILKFKVDPVKKLLADKRRKYYAN
ncbi:hypothetical protein [Leuconostoc citreum]|uniref:hypothetical protein n=1 Tax=Leuconostoc citreum TaxID=33964 RepID=UPI0032DF0A5B